MNKKEIYLPGLNGVRFLAVLFVIIAHIESFKYRLGFKQVFDLVYRGHLGSFGVTIFFTLSGFLITYLLKAEIQLTGTINTRNFYIRRILRIWPLYFLMVIICLFIIPKIPFFFNVYGESFAHHKYFWLHFLLLIVMLPNISLILTLLPYGNILWSIGVEEQFYLVWPVILKKTKKSILFVAIVCLSVFIILKIFFAAIASKGYGSLAWQFISWSRYSCLLIGAIAVELSGRKLLKTKWVQILALSAFLLMLTNTISFHYFYLFKSETQATIVAILLINISLNEDSFIKLENKVLNYLGKISYGLYIYHLFAITITLKLLSGLYTTISYTAWSAIVFIGTVTLTILLAHISYFYFERKILRKKLKYSVIVSGDQAKH
ncbi:MAG: acyltransferase [Chitinophagaceae bacterium]